MTRNILDDSLMIFILVKLARFVTPKEQELIANDLLKTLRGHSIPVTIINDSWGSRRRLLIQLKDKSRYSPNIQKLILQTPGVNSLILFSQSDFEFETTSLTDLLAHLEDYIVNKIRSNTVFITYQAFGRIPFHKKAILDRLKRKHIFHTGDAKHNLYIEVKRDKQTKEKQPVIKVRLGEKIGSTPIRNKKITSPTLILYSPFTIQEVADFFRLALTFKARVIFTNENKMVEKIIEQVEETYFKGLSKVEHQIIPNLDSIMENKERSLFYGFSLWGSDPITSLREKIESSGKKREEIFFIFGNEEKGIPLNVRKMILTFYIGVKASEPLRASQAAAYALGILNI